MVLIIAFPYINSFLWHNRDLFDDRFTVTRAHGPVDSLPTSHTCTFELKLPPYDTAEELRSKLRRAIVERHFGIQ